VNGDMISGRSPKRKRHIMYGVLRIIA